MVKNHDSKERSKHDLKRDFLDPIFLILNSKKFSQDVLSKLEKFNQKSKNELIIIRMYKEYLKMLDEVFDKWNSLRLMEKRKLSRNLSTLIYASIWLFNWP